MRGCGKMVFRPSSARPRGSSDHKSMIEDPETFFKARNRLRILLGVPRPGADVGKAKLLENTSEAYLGQINSKPGAENPFEIAAAPARKPILLRIGAGLHE